MARRNREKKKNGRMVCWDGGKVTQGENNRKIESRERGREKRTGKREDEAEERSEEQR